MSIKHNYRDILLWKTRRHIQRWIGETSGPYLLNCCQLSGYNSRVYILVFSFQPSVGQQLYFQNIDFMLVSWNMQRCFPA